MKKPIKKIARLLARHLRAQEKGRDQFKRSGLALDSAIALGVPLDTPIQLRDGRKVIVCDQFDGKNAAFASKVFQRYQVADYKERPMKVTRPEQAPKSGEVV